MLIGGIVGVGAASLIAGEIQWGLLIGLLVGISIAEVRTRGREKTGEVETDERVENNARKFMLTTMGASLFLLLIYYVLVTFFVCLFIGPSIIKRK